MALNDTVQLSVRGTLKGQQYIHTLHFRDLNGVGDPEQRMINSWQAACQAAWLAMHTNTYSLQEIESRQVCGGIPLRAPVIESVNLPGTRAAPAGHALAPWLSGLFRENTALAGKSRRGRFFISGLYEDDIQEEVIVSGFTPVMTAYANALTATFGSGGTNNDERLVVHSRSLALPGVQCQNSSTPVTQVAISTRLTTLRSRRA